VIDGLYPLLFEDKHIKRKHLIVFQQHGRRSHKTQKNQYIANTYDSCKPNFNMISTKKIIRPQHTGNFYLMKL